MTASRDPDRLIHAFFSEGLDELPYPVYDAVRDRIEQTRQRAVMGSWRTPDMNRYLKIGLAAAAVVVIAVVGFQYLGGPNTGSPGATETATPEPSPSPASPPPLTESFTSTVHGISMSYPEGWTAQAATEPWTDCLYCTAVHSAPYVDVLLHPVVDDGLFLRIASQPIGESAPEDWVAAQMADDDRCTTTEPIIVDGAMGLSGGDTCLVAVVTIAGRGYHIDLYVSPDNQDVVAQYDRAWFEEVLATVQLLPEDAVD
ncbi:MAG: hypothetical protein ABIQ05_04065 [Candidatus Limnocylindria bacterium]